MLSNKERCVIDVIYDKCLNENSCLIDVAEISFYVSHKKKMSDKEIEQVVDSLEREDYFDVIKTDRKGIPVMCITLHGKGKGYKREKLQTKRSTEYKIIISVLCALLTSLVGRLILLLFA